MKNLLNFLKSQKLLVIGCKSEGDLWVANVYYGADDRGCLYFISSVTTRHSRLILNNPKVAFSIAWFDPGSYKNRKAVQGSGFCRPAESEKEIEVGVGLHNKNFPEFSERITVEWIGDNERGSTVWVLKPQYIKHWDDELYGEDGTKEFSFS